MNAYAWSSLVPCNQIVENVIGQVERSVVNLAMAVPRSLSDLGLRAYESYRGRKIGNAPYTLVNRQFPVGLVDTMQII